MASLMGPPMLPGYSLRVQLFSPTAYAMGDKPIRCFRVVTSPEVTIREFCQEASRIHEINYGEPLAIKKVQDDQEFDITQSEILGNLFANTAMIRVVQASANPTVRDSVPPTSALRFDPTTSRKRDRASPNGFANSLKPHKRQRIAELDPDQPLPSREVIPAHTNGYAPEVLVPNSQENFMLGNNTLYVRPQQIEETPEPTALCFTPIYENGVADRQGPKKNEDHFSPLREASTRAQSHLLNGKAKSASYHIQRATERGTSVSTAATSPPSDGQRNTQNGNTSASRRRRNEEIHRSTNEDNIYDTIVSEDDSAKVPKPKKLLLKARSSPNGLPGMEWAKNKALNTPPSLGRRSREPTTTPGELPLTPSSREREARKRERKEEEDIKKARLAAAQAAEQRQREAEEARLEDERRAAEVERARREEEEQRQVEEFNRAETERKAKAEKMRKEKEAREAREAEEARVAKVEAERSQKETEAALKRVEEEKHQEKARIAKEKTKEKEREKGESEKKSENIPSSRLKTSSSPVLPRSTPRAKSSTSYIPTGKATLGMRSILKSSPARASPDHESNESNTEERASSAKPRQRTVSFDVGTQPPPIRPESRILPPKLSISKAKTPIQAPKRSLASKAIPELSTASSAPPPKQKSSVSSSIKSGSAERSASPAVAKSLVPRSTSAIPPPTKISPVPPPPRQSSSIKPAPSKPVQSPATNEKSKSIVKPKPVELSDDEFEEDSDEESVYENEEDIEMADAPPTRKERPIATTEVVHDSLEDEDSESSTSDDVEMSQAASTKENQASWKTPDDKHEDEISESDENEKEAKLPDNFASKPVITSPTTVLIPGDEDEDEKEEPDPEATQSQNSSPRESRSPVIFSRNPSTTAAAKLQKIPPLHQEEDEQSDDESTPRSKTNPALLQAESTSTSDSESVDDDEESQIQVPKSSPPLLPQHINRKTVNSGPSLSQISNKGPTNTQTEVDNQLTSSLGRHNSSAPVPIPASSTINRPPKMKFGASLSSLNQKKTLTLTSSQLKPKPTINGLRKAEEGSESEEDSDESSSSSDDTDMPAKAPVTPKRKQIAIEEDDSDTSSTSESDKEKSDSQRVRDELSKKIASVMASTETPRKNVTQSASKIYGSGKSNKYLTGYSFSQPGI